MTYTDPFGRRFRPTQANRQARANAQYQAGARGSGTGQPTLEDYHQLSDAFQSLQKRLEESQAQIEATQEALRQQTKSAMDFQDQLGLAYQQIEQMTQERDDALALTEDRLAELTALQRETTNYRTRLEQRLEREAEEKRLAVLRDMLPLADHLEMAIAYWDQNEGADADGSFRANLIATRNAFLDSLRRHGVQPQQPVGERFNPELYEAVGQVPNADIPAEHVALVVQTGYTADDQLLRPARVLVSSGSADAEGV
ncbi:MAG: nucleotide exchange factor GrpE [Caldilineaceae bacterium]|nr:nucleotide exchange factor GrpE [Caldilineaceae bacterium]